MNALRRNMLKGTGAAGAVAVAVAAGLLKPGAALAATWNAAAFESKNVADALKGLGTPAAADSKDITIKAPDIAENGAVVPVEVTASMAGVDRIIIMAEKNVRPLLADFSLAHGAQGYISTRIKMGQTANVRAIVMAGGKAFQAAKEVKVTIGGCGG
jgi:sulfur-oxidizing protein SoxY